MIEPHREALWLKEIQQFDVDVHKGYSRERFQCQLYHDEDSELSLDLSLAKIDLQDISYLLTSIPTPCGQALMQTSEEL